jgi:integral membrane sensor domain MASE1
VSPTEEKKLLACVLARLDQPATSIFATKWLLPVTWLLCVVVLFAAFKLGQYFGQLVLAIVCALLGAFVGVVFFARAAAVQEPIMRAHIDRASITRRLTELDA